WRELMATDAIQRLSPCLPSNPHRIENWRRARQCEESPMIEPEGTLSRRSFTKVSLAASVALTAGGAILPRALAQEATPVGGEAPAGNQGELPPLPEGATLYAQDLWNPRAIQFGDDGTLYITENGIG